MDDVLELLDRQSEFLLAQPRDDDFLVQVGPFLDALTGEPRLAVHLDDLQREAIQHLQVLEDLDTELLPTLAELRAELVELRPALDDSHEQRPTGDPPSELDSTLARFDALATSPPPALNAKGEGSRTEQMLAILDNKARLDQYERQANAAHDEPEMNTADAADDRAAATIEPVEADDLSDWRVRLGTLHDRWTHAQRATALSLRTSGGLALLQLRLVPDAVNPDFAELAPRGDRLARANAMFKWSFSSERLLYFAVQGQLSDKPSNELVAERVEHLRGCVARLREEVRRRVGTTRSRLALVHRFKLRAEWHDRERLARLADDRSGSGGPEDRLTAELALFLFDQGLFPITKPLTGGLQPDLLDASVRPAFYVEAKQYKASARAEIVQAVAQVLDTVGRLQGGAYAVEEAFCVVFRRSGPRYVLPDLLQVEGYRLYLVLVDIAPPELSGRRQSERPVEIAATEMLSAAEGLRAATLADGETSAQR